MQLRPSVYLGFALSLLGCSDDDAPKEAVSFSAELSVAPGEETVQCQFVQMPSDKGEMAVSNAHHTYSEGSHHFLLFRTELTEIPEGGDQLTPCEEGDAEWMGHVRGVVYAAQDAEGSFGFPAGVGMTFEPGEVMLMQSHYLNTSGAQLDARIDVSLELANPAEVTDEAGIIFYYNPKISVPPMGSSTATLTCPVSTDINLAFASSHMHKRGSHFVATTDDSGAMAQAGDALYTTQDWEEPVPRVFADDESALTISSGSTISYTCTFDNPDPFTVLSGPSADTNEMCMFVGMYWPRTDESFEWCYDGLTDGEGTASAESTLTCLFLCGQNDPECSSGCWDNACPNAPMKIAQTRDCLFDCIGDCLGGLASETCATCMNDACPQPYEELMSATCE